MLGTQSPEDQRGLNQGQMELYLFASCLALGSERSDVEPLLSSSGKAGQRKPAICRDGGAHTPHLQTKSMSTDAYQTLIGHWEVLYRDLLQLIHMPPHEVGIIPTFGEETEAREVK